MKKESLEKFSKVVQEPCSRIPVEQAIITEFLWGSRHKLDYSYLSASSGPSACFEFTRSQGGQIRDLSEVCKTSIDYHYDLRTLERTDHDKRIKIDNIRDVINYDIHRLIHDPHVTDVKVHVVAELGKARVVTAPSASLTRCSAVLAHLLTPLLKVYQWVRSGLKADRHLWSFLKNDMDTSNTVNCFSNSDEIFCLNSDLETATDYANVDFGFELMLYLVKFLSEDPNFPSAFALLVITKVFDDRLLVFEDQEFKPIVKKRGWLMGDRLTKFLFTLSQLYLMRLSLLEYPKNIHVAGSIVGDDIVILSNDKSFFDTYVSVLKRHEFHVSEDDHYVSKRIMFFCEELSLIPKANSCIDDYINNNEIIPFLDVPRLRLLNGQISESQRHSDLSEGKFQLIGKEILFVLRLQTRAYTRIVYRNAVLLQNLVVLKPAETLCRYVPLEIGGNGSFMDDPDFLSSIVEKCKDPPLIKARLQQLTQTGVHYAYMHVNRYDRFGYKCSINISPKSISDLGIPASKLIIPKTQEQKLLLGSLKSKSLVSGEEAYLRIMNRDYYREIMSVGYNPDLPIFKREFTQNIVKVKDIPKEVYRRVLSIWKYRGLKFHNPNQVYVDPDYIPEIKYLSFPYINAKGQKRILDKHIDFRELKYDDVLGALLRQNYMDPTQDYKTIQLYVESDSYLLSYVEHHYVYDVKKRIYLFIIYTEDVALYGSVVEILLKKGFEESTFIRCPGVLFLTENPILEIFKCLEPIEQIVDPGYMRKIDSIWFTNGMLRHRFGWAASSSLVVTVGKRKPSLMGMDTPYLIAWLRQTPSDDDRGPTVYYMKYIMGLRSLWISLGRSEEGLLTWLKDKFLFLWSSFSSSLHWMDVAPPNM